MSFVFVTLSTDSNGGSPVDVFEHLLLQVVFLSLTGQRQELLLLLLPSRHPRNYIFRSFGAISKNTNLSFGSQKQPARASYLKKKNQIGERDRSQYFGCLFEVRFRGAMLQ